MIDWIRPSGTKISTHDTPDTIKYCESLGWKREQEVVTETKVKRKRRTPAQMAEARNGEGIASN